MHYTWSNPRAELIVEEDRMATLKGGQDASTSSEIGSMKSEANIAIWP